MKTLGFEGEVIHVSKREIKNEHAIKSYKILSDISSKSSPYTPSEGVTMSRS